MMVAKGDDWKDIMSYVKFRKEHLILERQKIPYTVKPKQRGKAMLKLTGRIAELSSLIKILNSDIKDCSKYEYSKLQYLKKLKDENVRKQGGNPAKLVLDVRATK